MKLRDSAFRVALSPFAWAAAGLLELSSSCLRLCFAMAIATILAISLGGGLYFSGQALRTAVRSSRQTVRSSTSISAQQKLREDLRVARQLLHLKKPFADQRATANN